jgi:hypothetical protein
MFADMTFDDFGSSIVTDSSFPCAVVVSALMMNFDELCIDGDVSRLQFLL